MARMLGKSWKWRKDTRWHKRVEAREVKRDLDYYPSGYSPATLLATRPDGPDPTGRLIGVEEMSAE